MLDLNSTGQNCMTYQSATGDNADQFQTCPFPGTPGTSLSPHKKSTRDRTTRLRVDVNVSKARSDTASDQDGDVSPRSHPHLAKGCPSPEGSQCDTNALRITVGSGASATTVQSSRGLDAAQQHDFRELQEGFLDPLRHIEGSIQSAWENTCRQQIDAIVAHELQDDTCHTQELLWAARRRRFGSESFQPTIVLSVEGTKQRELVRKAFHKLQWLRKSVADCRLEFMVIVDPVMLQCAMDDAGAAETPVTFASECVLESRDSSNTIRSHCGTRIVVRRFTDPLKTQTSTMGGVVLVGNRLFGLTTAHGTFADRHFKMTAKAIYKDEISHVLDDAFQRALRPTADDASDGILTVVPLTPQQATVVALPASGHLMPKASTSDMVLRTLAPVPSILHRQSNRDTRNCDWALVELPQHDGFVYNQYMYGGVHKAVDCITVTEADAPSPVSIIIDSRTIMAGKLSSRPASYSKGSLLFDVRLVILETDLRKSYSLGTLLQLTT